MAASSRSLELEIRKLRKKLRQIEHLESTGSARNEDERHKIAKKGALRSRLQKLLAQLPERESGQNWQNEEVQNADDEMSGYSYATSSYDSYNTSRDISRELFDEEVEEEEEDEGERRPQVTADDGQHIISNFSQDEVVKEKPSVCAPKITQKRKLEEERCVAGPSGDSSSVKQTKDADSQKSKKKDKKSELKKWWKSTQYRVRYLEGHNDLVSAVATDGEIAVSGSRDTTVKLWHVATATETRSMGGHTDAVTSVVLLSREQSQELAPVFEVPPEQRVCISGSSDCSIKVWSITTGHELKSMYTYNPVSCLAYIPDRRLIVSGSSGGKVELWDPETGENVQSSRGHEDAVTCFLVKDGYVYSASADGMVKVHQLREDKTLHVIYASENIKASNGIDLTVRHIRCLAAANQMIYYGDDGVNIKALNWKTGMVRKLPNHVCEVGITDGISVCSNNLLISSAYDLDRGAGYINLRSIAEEEQYLISLDDEDTSRILCLDCASSCQQKGMITIVTGGFELKIWEQIKGGTSENQEDVIRPKYFTRYNRPAHDSEMETDFDSENTENYSESSESENDDDDAPRKRHREGSEQVDQKGWFSSCSIL